MPASLNVERGRTVCVIDSDILIDLLRGRPKARELCREWSAKGILAVSVISCVEVLQGARPHEKAATRALLESLRCIPLSVPLAWAAADLLGAQRMRGITVDLADAVVAATALDLGVPVLTNNLRHYAFPGLRVMPLNRQS